MEINNVIDFLRNVQGRDVSSAKVVEINAFLTDQKKIFVSNNQQNEAKEVWCLEQVLLIQEKYLDAFKQIKEGRFYDAWRVLERCEIELGFLTPHFSESYHSYRLDFIEAKVHQFQTLYPYKIFMSPEILEIQKQCNICGQKVIIRKPCGHEIGEIYNGEMCVRIITEVEFLGASFVYSPLQKYSVPFLKGGKDHYDYRLLNSLVDKLDSPFADWNLEWTKKRHPHAKFKDLGRNDKCPCGSGIKYKKCCLEKEGILLPHCIFQIPGAKPFEDNVFY